MWSRKLPPTADVAEILGTKAIDVNSDEYQGLVMTYNRSSHPHSASSFSWTHQALSYIFMSRLRSEII